MTTKIKVFNNSTNIQDMFLDLMYSDSPVKYISGLHPEWSITKPITAFVHTTKILNRFIQLGVKMTYREKRVKEDLYR